MIYTDKSFRAFEIKQYHIMKQKPRQALKNYKILDIGAKFDNKIIFLLFENKHKICA